MKIDIKKYGLKLTHKFRIARETQTICYNLFLKINIKGLTGYGESAPTLYYDENIDTIYNGVKLIYDIDDPDLENPSLFFEELEKVYPNYPSLRAGIEMAVYDIIGKRKKKSVRGNTINQQIVQVNMKVMKPGAKPIDEIIKAEGKTETKEVSSPKEKKEEQ